MYARLHTRRPRACNHKLQVKVSRIVLLDSLPGCKGLLLEPWRSPLGAILEPLGAISEPSWVCVCENRAPEGSRGGQNRSLEGPREGSERTSARRQRYVTKQNYFLSSSHVKAPPRAFWHPKGCTKATQNTASKERSKKFQRNQPKGCLGPNQSPQRLHRPPNGHRHRRKNALGPCLANLPLGLEFWGAPGEFLGVRGWSWCAWCSRGAAGCFW